MKKISLELTIEEANKILEALGNLPFSQVHQLISNIQQQAAAQLNSNGQQTPADVSAEKE